jgi:predicted negative regulator of RcsB-dependent stress response
MNEVYENKATTTSLRNFYSKHRNLILIFIVILILFILSIFVINQVNKSNNNKAAEIYNKWTIQETETIDGKILSEQLFDELLNSYKKTGYTRIALLNNAASNIKNNENEAALTNYLALKDLTDGYNGNNLFNKIARINASRLLYDKGDYDQALDMLKKYSSSSSNGIIHELTGDILYKQNKITLAKDQYLLAKDKYSDELSLSIISMKIYNIEL